MPHTPDTRMDCTLSTCVPHGASWQMFGHTLTLCNPWGSRGSLLDHMTMPRHCIPDQRFLGPPLVSPSGLQRLVISVVAQVLKPTGLISFYLLIHLFLIAWWDHSLPDLVPKWQQKFHNSVMSWGLASFIIYTLNFIPTESSCQCVTLQVVNLLQVGKPLQVAQCYLIYRVFGSDSSGYNCGVSLNHLAHWRKGPNTS